MSEVNLAALAESSKDQIEAKAPAPFKEFDAALRECKFGWYQIRVLCGGLFAIISGINISNTSPYILPNAECDLDMDLVQKGLLNAAPFIGMLMSSVAAGFLTDAFGRKIFLVSSYGIISCLIVISAFTQTYEMLISCKFLEGFVFAIAHGACMSLTAENCHNGIRDRVMLFQSSFQSLSQVILALISWGVLLYDWKVTLFNGYIVLYTWNFYLLIMAIFPLTACIIYILTPESPKFLISQGRYDEARETLKMIYRVNTGKPDDTFPYADIWKTKPYIIQEEPESKKNTFSSQLVSGLHNIKPMFRRPLLSYLVLFCVMNFLTMILYNVIRLWFPQLSTIVEHYTPEEGHAELCTMLDAYTADLRTRALNVTEVKSDVCVPARSGPETYINSIILGFISLVPYFLTGVLVNKIGKKFLIMGAGLLAVAGTLWLRWASSKAQVVGLFSADMALGQSMMSLLQATTIEVFPTTSRTLGLAMMMMVGRIGSLVGNVLFPILLNMGCVVPFYTLAGLMTFVTILTVFLPKKKKN